MKNDTGNHGLGPSNLFTLHVVCCVDRVNKGAIEQEVKRALKYLADAGHVVNVYDPDFILCDVSDRINKTL